MPWIRPWRELGSRFDFKNVDASIELEGDSVLISAPEEFQIKQVESILRDKLSARNVDTRCLAPGSGGRCRQT